jgi:rifampin ADP-ribosylating transferase
MEFSPKNHVVKLCLQGMNLEENGSAEEAKNIFLRAWDEAASGFDKFIAAHFVARHQKNIADQLTWLHTQLSLALQVNDEAVKPAFAPLYSKIGECYQQLRDAENSKKYFTLASSCTQKPADRGPFYHGTKAYLKPGDLLTPGFGSNYKSDLIMNHIYFTAMINGAGLAASMAKGDGEERVYIVEPTGEFEDDPNVTNKKFPGNPTRSYRTDSPLKIIGELRDWARQTPEEREKWRERLANNKGEIIN